MPAGLKVVAWLRLIKVFGVLRADDVRRLRPKDVSMGEAGLQAKLLRTKTTGPGKKVRELPVFIPVQAGFTGLPWLKDGYDLWSDMIREDADYFIPCLGASMDDFVDRVPSTGDLAGMAPNGPSSRAPPW